MEEERPCEKVANIFLTEVFVGSRGGFFKKSPWLPEALN